MNFDLGGVLRALKPQKRIGAIEQRSDADQHWADGEAPIGGPLLLDTCVYLDVLQARTPAAVDILLGSRICHHSAVSLAELTHLFGRLDPLHAATKGVLQRLRGAIDDIPKHRLHAPDAAAWGEAGILAGALARLGDFPKGDGAIGKFLNDALIFLQARQLGASVLTRNIRDFDALEQLVPGGQVVFYRRADPS